MSLQMIALDAHKRARDISLQSSSTAAGTQSSCTPAAGAQLSQLLPSSYYVDAVFHQPLTGVVDVQQEVVIETTATTPTAAGHPVTVQQNNVRIHDFLPF